MTNSNYDSSVDTEVATFEHVNDGMPIVLKMLNDQEVLATAVSNPFTGKFLVIRPVVIKHKRDVDPDDGEDDTKFVANVEKYILYTDSKIVGINPKVIAAVCPLSQALINSYIQWADRFYGPAPIEDHEIPVQPPTDTAQNIADETKRYIDFVTHTMPTVGKKN